MQVAQSILHLYKTCNQSNITSTTFVVHCIDEMYKIEPVKDTISTTINPHFIALQFKEKITREAFKLRVLQKNFATLLKETKAPDGICPCDTIKIKGVNYHTEASEFLEHFKKQQDQGNKLYKVGCQTVTSAIDFDIGNANIPQVKEFSTLITAIPAIVAAVTEVTSIEKGFRFQPVVTTDKQKMKVVLAASMALWQSYES